MKPSPEFVISQLKSNTSIFKALLSNIPEEQEIWNPSADKWSLLEIICHLVDEEILDFRTRVETALYPEQKEFIPIDPVGWVQSHQYMQQRFEVKLKQWIEERSRSVEWLISLKSPNWNNYLNHPELGQLSAGQFLANWLAHDHIHIRQINRTKRAYLEHISDQDLSYAGKW